MADTHELYNGEIVMEFNPSAHRYKINGDYKQGVTTILGSVTNKDGLIKWAADMTADAFAADLSAFLAKGGVITDAAIKKASDSAKTAHTSRRDSAADIGSLCHEWISEYINEVIDDNKSM